MEPKVTSSQAIQEFAKLLVQEVRDRAIRSCDTGREGVGSTPSAQRWRKLLGQDGKTAMSALIPDCVDSTLFHLLDAIDNGVMKLQFVASDGTTVDLESAGEGEMDGWYIGEDGWRDWYSNERCSSWLDPESSPTVPRKT